MTSDTGTPRATNVVITNRESALITTKKVETATNVYPGRLLEKGTNDDDIVVCGGSNPVVGVAGYEDTPKLYRPATKATIYTASAKLAVVRGPGTKVILRIASGEAAVVGSILKASTAGMVAVATAGTDHVIAKANETVTGAASVGSDIECILIGV